MAMDTGIPIAPATNPWNTLNGISTAAAGTPYKKDWKMKYPKGIITAPAAQAIRVFFRVLPSLSPARVPTTYPSIPLITVVGMTQLYHPPSKSANPEPRPPATAPTIGPNALSEIEEKICHI